MPLPVNSTPASQPKIDYIREELRAMAPKYDIVRDCMGGELVIKKAGDKYLPRPNASDISNENLVRYESYLQRAVFYGVTGRTEGGLVGQVFKKTPEAQLPPVLDVLKQDVDGAGMTLDQQSKKALGYTLQFGRAGILVDYPQGVTNATKAQQQKGEVRPNVLLYEASAVINWRTVFKNGKTLLSLVVIREAAVVSDDGFEAKMEDRYRVLKLDGGGLYVVEIWQKNTTGGAIWTMLESFQPTKGDGQRWQEIPFTFVGSENNDADPDEPPLYSLASLNLAHYRNSADYEESAYMVGQPTPVVCGVDKQWVDEVLKGTVVLGSRGIVSLPKDASAELLQADANGLAKEAMDQKEVQMRAMGARLVEQRKVEQTAQEAGQNENTDLSVLASCANNVSSAYTQALKWAAEFSNAPEEDIVYKLNTEFDQPFGNSADWAAIMSLKQMQGITSKEMRSALTRAGIAFESFEDWKDSIETDGEGLGLPAKQGEVDRANDEAAARVQAAKKKTAAKA